MDKNHINNKEILTDTINTFEAMIRAYNERGGGYSQKEALKLAITVLREKIEEDKEREFVIDEAYLKDIIYITTQHLKLPDKDVALLNRCLSDALLRANLIKVRGK